MWHINQKLILLVGFFLKGITWHGGGEGSLASCMAGASKCLP